jgi:hypothetical protein
MACWAHLNAYPITTTVTLDAEQAARVLAWYNAQPPASALHFDLIVMVRRARAEWFNVLFDPRAREAWRKAWFKVLFDRQPRPAWFKVLFDRPPG